jgi:hypothetical protein
MSMTARAPPDRQDHGDLATFLMSGSATSTSTTGSPVARPTSGPPVAG